MTKILTPLLGVAALSIALAGCVAGQTASSATSATPFGETSAPASFDTPMPAPQAPFDTTPITAVETVGAPRTE